MRSLREDLQGKVVGFTGTRYGMKPEQLCELTEILDFLKPTALHHGDCKGADTQAHVLAGAFGVRRILHPPIKAKWRAFNRGEETLPKKEYIDRDHDIVDACDVLIATPRGKREIWRSGTWSTVRYARYVGKEVILILPE